MTPHRLVPTVLLAALVLLTIGFAVLALFMAPNSATLTVHNGTLETFSGDQFSMSVATRTVSSQQQGVAAEVLVVNYNSPDRIVITRAAPKPHLSKTVPQDEVTTELSRYTAVTAGPTDWVRQGSHFERTETIKEFSARQGQPNGLPGQVKETAFVRNGYLTLLELTLHANVASSTSGEPVSISEQETLHLLRINGAQAPAVTS